MCRLAWICLHSRRQVVKSISSGAHASLYRLDLSRETKDAAGDTAAFGRGMCCHVFRSSRKKDSVTSACSSPDTMPLPAPTKISPTANSDATSSECGEGRTDGIWVISRDEQNHCRHGHSASERQKAMRAWGLRPNALQPGRRALERRSAVVSGRGFVLSVAASRRLRQLFALRLDRRRAVGGHGWGQQQPFPLSGFGRRGKRGRLRIPASSSSEESPQTACGNATATSVSGAQAEASQVIPTPSHLLDRISPISPPFPPVFCAFSPS
eukprot:COSAG04_NODE_2762_length_3624_cov_25.032340_2_plen_268_part_00